VLHLSSSDKQRKGTLELVQAFGVGMERGLLPPGATLQLVLTPAGRAALLDWMMDRAPMPFLRHSSRLFGDGADPEQLSQIYSAMHLVCQPSRGEGFGMVPLESLACGTPIAATAETGHSEWFRTDLPGATVVKTRGMGPIDDAALATGPLVDVEDIATALGEAYSAWHEKKAEAIGNVEALRERWSWPNQLRSFFNWAESEVRP
jgi:glycosyltransferase involved in cell wall biosynthesis